MLSAAYDIAQFMQTYDVILTSTLGVPPLRVGELDFEKQPERANEKIGAFVPYTWVFNATGQPAMSVPLDWNAAGVPIGSHFVGRFGEEGLLFRLAGQLERTGPGPIASRACRRVEKCSGPTLAKATKGPFAAGAKLARREPKSSANQGRPSLNAAQSVCLSRFDRQRLVRSGRSEPDWAVVVAGR